MATLLINVDLGGGLLLNLNEPWVGAAPGLHAATHQNGGADEINVAGLSGLLADDQNPTLHAVDHQNGGVDEIDVVGLSGLLADAQTPLAHDIQGAAHTASGLTAGEVLRATGATTFAFQALVAGDIPLIDHGTGLVGASLLDDDHTIYALLAGRAGGQTLIGGTAAGNALALRASAAAGGGLIETFHPIRSNYSEGNTTPAEQTGFGIWEPTFTTSGAFIGQMLRNDAQITYTNAFYIYASVLDRSVHISNAAAGFQAFTLFNALPTVRNGTSNDLVQMLILNDGGTHERSTSGTSVAIQHLTISASPQIRALVSGAVMTWSTGATGLSFAPKFSTAAGSTVNMGALTGLDMIAPAVALFQPSAGTENITSIRGINFPAMVNAVSSDISVVRSALNAAATRFFLNHTGTAQSVLNGQLRIPRDLTGLTLGLSDDFQQGWGAANFWFWQFNGTGNQIRWSNPSAQRYLMTTDTGTSEYNFNCSRFSLGAQTGAVGNQVGVFVAPARATSIPGGWSDFLLTQGGSLTLNHAMSQVFGWTINAPSMVLGGGGSATDTGALLVGGNVNQGTNRYGLLIISNPTGGTLNYAFRQSNASARARFDGRLDINRGIALGGGAGATLGTIGATGPTAAAQAQWVEIDIGGVAHWIPVWV